MKKILVLMLFCSVFVLGCDNSNNEIDEMMFEEEVISNDVGQNNNQENQNIDDMDIVSEALRIGMEQYNAKNFDGAIETYTKAIEQVPNNAGLYADRGRAKRDSGDMDGAIQDVSKSLELNPNEGWIYAERAVIYRAKGEIALALKDYKKALELDPNMDWVKQAIQELEAE